MKKPFSKIGAFVFALVALIHLYRLINHFEVVVSGYLVPYWVNVAGLIIAPILSIGLWRESKKLK